MFAGDGAVAAAYKELAKGLTDISLSPEYLETQWDQVLKEDERARRGMDSQAAVHLLLIVFIIVGNIGYFSSRRRRGGQ